MNEDCDWHSVKKHYIDTGGEEWEGWGDLLYMTLEELLTCL